MRTTIDLPDDLIEEAKKRAARERRTLSDVVTDAVRGSFARGGDPRGTGAAAGRLATFGAGGVQPGVDLDDGAALLDLMEGGA